MPEVARQVIVSGRVQGVFYRASTRDTARRLGVTGWVRNLADGRVEALLVGGADAVDAMIEWMWEGPPSARVVDVDSRAVSPPGGEILKGFDVR